MALIAFAHGESARRW